MTWHGKRISYKATSTAALVHTDYAQEITAIEIFFGENAAIQCDGVTGMHESTETISIGAGHQNQMLGDAGNDIVYKRTGDMIAYTYYPSSASSAASIAALHMVELSSRNSYPVPEPWFEECEFVAPESETNLNPALVQAWETYSAGFGNIGTPDSSDISVNWWESNTPISYPICP